MGFHGRKVDVYLRPLFDQLLYIGIGKVTGGEVNFVEAFGLLSSGLYVPNVSCGVRVVLSQSMSNSGL